MARNIKGHNKLRGSGDRRNPQAALKSKAHKTAKTKGRGAPNRGGRPPIVIGPQELSQMEALAGYGLTEAAIAAVLGMTSRTLREKKHAEEVSSALARGKAKAEGRVGKALYERAIAGDIQAIRWWETTRAGRSDKQEITGRDGAPLRIILTDGSE